jgi:hypothetical protein
MFVPTKYQNMNHSYQILLNLDLYAMRILGLWGRVSAFLLELFGCASCVNPTRFDYIHSTGKVTRRIFTQLGVCEELRQTIVIKN